MMLAVDVVRVMERLRDSGITAWIDGGWGVDALLEQETRQHDDLDLVIELDQADLATEALATLGYEVSIDERPTRLVLTTADGRRVDLHTVVFDEGGGGVQHLQDGRSYRYPPMGFTGNGTVAGQPFACLTPEVQIECHMGYEPTETDRHDVVLLVERFALPRPKGY